MMNAGQWLGVMLVLVGFASLVVEQFSSWKSAATKRRPRTSSSPTRGGASGLALLGFGRRTA
jgi:hypothetical protein